jgi:ABC-type multidrug transport system fused ATPase/permease subunit
MVEPVLARYGQRSSKERADLYKLATDVLRSIAEIKVLRREPFFIRRFEELSRSASAHDARSYVIRQLPRYVVETVAFIGMVVVVIFMAGFYSRPDDLWPLVAIYAVAAYRLLPAAQQIFYNISAIRYYWPAIENVAKELTPSKSPAIQVTVPRRIAKVAGVAGRPALEFRDVAFAYSASRGPVIDRLSFTVEPGQSVGVVGRSGAGKSTMLALALGLLEPDGGAVSVYGVPASEALQQARIGYVSQHPAFLNDTLKRNVAFGIEDRDIDIDRVREALDKAGLGEFTERLADGLETWVGEGGSALSGGQRQRLALARALYLDADLLVLDEFTSALDAETERGVLDALASAMKERTMLIATHEPVVLRVCHRVIEI